MDGVLDRPFYFIVVLWGERFREYFLEFCVPSMLSPGNLPALATRQTSKFLIATTAADWAAMQSLPIFSAMQRYLEVELVEIPPCPPERSSYDHMGLGHKLACGRAFRDDAYAMVLTPDCMLSDGTIARLQQLAVAGYQLVVAAAIRFSEEAFLGRLKTIGVLPDVSRSKSGAPLVITGPQMAYAAVNGLHGEALAYEWDAPGFLLVVPAAWWRVPGENGILLHSLSWAPMLLDYGAIPNHDMSTLDQWTLDGDYLFNNAKSMSKVYVVQDSDELFLASWGPAVEGQIYKHHVPLLGRLVAKAQFGASFKSAFFDPFKRRILFQPVRWHAEPLGEKWNAIEANALRELLRYATPPDTSLFFGAHSRTERARRVSARTLTSLLVVLRPLLIVIYYPQNLWRKLRQAASGDRDSIRQLFWYLRLFGLNKY
jgi:hypothetical protein